MLAADAAPQLASRSTDEWIKLLESPDRVKGLRIDEFVGKLRLKNGEVVADVGAGTGVFSLPLARAVGPGKVYAVEVDRGLVDYIRTKASTQKVRNVETVLGQFTDPALPSKDVDLAFFHDVLHHIADRLATWPARDLHEAVGADGIRGDGRRDGAHRNEPALQLTRAQLDGWMTNLGFKRQERADLSRDKWFAVYGR